MYKRGDGAETYAHHNNICMGLSVGPLRMITHSNFRWDENSSCVQICDVLSKKKKKGPLLLNDDCHKLNMHKI